MLNEIKNKIINAESSQLLLGQLERNESGIIPITGISGSLLAGLLSGIYQSAEKPIIAVLPDNEQASQLQGDLNTLAASDDIYNLCPRGIFPFQTKTTYFETTGSKLEAMYAMLKDSPIVVASADAVCERTMPPSELLRLSLKIAVGRSIDMTELVEYLSNSGYKRVRLVEEIGDFAVRGGIIDLFPTTSEHPLRIEFFGDEVESIRTFSVSTQRSLDQKDGILLLPRREFQMTDNDLEYIMAEFSPEQAEALHEALLVDDPLPGLEWLAPLAGMPTVSAAEYFPDDAIIVLVEEEIIKEEFDIFRERSEQYLKSADSSGFPTADLDRFVDSFDTFEGSIKSNTKIEVLPFRETGQDDLIDFASYQPVFSGLSSEKMLNQIDGFLGKGFTVYIACDNAKQKDRIEELLGEGRPDILFEIARLEHGFVLPQAQLALLTDHQLFGHKVRRRPRRFKEGISLPNYRSLNPDDYVVHIDFGVGKYIGLKTINVEGRRRDCLYIKFKDEDRIYVPIEQFNRVQKYAGSESQPKLSKLGGTAWKKTVNRAKKAIMEMAQELLAIYARRRVSPGFKFPPDSEWQKQLEASFPYEETPDQIKSLEEIKSDLESEIPMDRLICGDVGYGKTEVALRAAFKAVDSGKQVAVVAPTTILAQQHFETFKDSMENFPVKIEMLSRFVERGKQKKVIAALKNGEVDIVIGTHRLLSRDIEFNDIGLLVVDEEQRFGVAHKEKLKRWRTVVDVLTLTATPIPRTMQLSLFGARDMTIINTPPKDRRPIITEVAQFSDRSIAEPILRETDRGGQVYFVHNRIESIDAIARYLYKILPNVTFNVAHGQMKERQLEDIMYRFSKGKFQCLISTTIIESGLDIPSVNTIIINRADKLGLAQLYQLRGRVGRSDRQAYAYFLIPPYRLLTTTARRRLKAMEEFTALGSGFNLALRDLEIRGAGNFLGPQQHGFIEEIGFDMYCRLLDEAVAELKGEEVTEGVDTKLTIDCDLYVPDNYIEEKDLRVELYRRLADSKEYDEVDSIFEDTRDRFGEPPDTVFNLFLMSKIRIASNKLGFARVTIKGERIFAEFPEIAKLTKRIVEGFVKSISQRIHFYTTDAFQMEILLQGLREKRGLQAVVDIMQRLENSFTSEKDLKDEEKINR